MWIKDIALSNSRPSSSPFSIPIRPPSGWGVFFVIPAASRALLLTTMQWPQARVAQMGTSLEISSRSYRLGIRSTSEK